MHALMHQCARRIEKGPRSEWPVPDTYGACLLLREWVGCVEYGPLAHRKWLGRVESGRDARNRAGCVRNTSGDVDLACNGTECIGTRLEACAVAAGRVVWAGRMFGVLGARRVCRMGWVARKEAGVHPEEARKAVGRSLARWVRGCSTGQVEPGRGASAGPGNVSGGVGRVGDAWGTSTEPGDVEPGRGHVETGLGACREGGACAERAGHVQEWPGGMAGKGGRVWGAERRGAHAVAAGCVVGAVAGLSAMGAWRGRGWGLLRGSVRAGAPWRGGCASRRDGAR